MFEMFSGLNARLEGHTDEYAGNYQGTIFMRPPDFATASLIRKSI